MNVEDVEHLSIDEFRLNFFLTSPTLGRKRRRFADETLIKEAGELIRQEMKNSAKNTLQNLCSIMPRAFAIF